MFLSPDFLVDEYSQEFVGTDDWDLHALQEYRVPLCRPGGGPLGQVHFSSSGQSHNSNLSIVKSQWCVQDQSSLPLGHSIICLTLLLASLSVLPCIYEGYSCSITPWFTFVN